jgi:hypothetical protein
MTGSGHVAVTGSTLISHRVFDEGELVLTVVNNTFTITGTLSGHAWAVERDLNHTDTGRITFRGMAHFTGSLNDMSGTLLIRYGGVNNGTFITGHFVVSGGTGQLAGVHGHGTFQGKVTAPLSYSLSWTVRIHHAEHEDETQVKDTD